MKILAIEHELKAASRADDGPALQDEARQVYRLYLRDRVREIYFNERHCAVIVMECGSKREAAALLGRLPLVKNRSIEFQVMELRPYAGWSRLMR